MQDTQFVIGLGLAAFLFAILDALVAVNYGVVAVVFLILEAIALCMIVYWALSNETPINTPNINKAWKEA